MGLRAMVEGSMFDGGGVRAQFQNSAGRLRKGIGDVALLKQSEVIDR